MIRVFCDRCNELVSHQNRATRIVGIEEGTGDNFRHWSVEVNVYGTNLGTVTLCHGCVIEITGLAHQKMVGNELDHP